MMNVGELIFEQMLENMKRASGGNMALRNFVDSVSYEYNRGRFSDCLNRINEENAAIINICYHINQRGGYATPHEQYELQRLMAQKNVDEAKSMKHLASGARDAQEIVARITF